MCVCAFSDCGGYLCVFGESCYNPAVLGPFGWVLFKISPASFTPPICAQLACHWTVSSLSLCSQTGSLSVFPDWVSACVPRLCLCLCSQTVLLPVFPDCASACVPRLCLCLCPLTGSLPVFPDWVSPCVPRLGLSLCSQTGLSLCSQTRSLPVFPDSPCVPRLC